MKKKSPIKLKKKEVIAGAIILALALALILYTFRGVLFVGKTDRDRTVDQAPQEEQIIYRHPLTGQIVPEIMTRPQAFGVMIDNSIDALPQSGIDQAFLVIEAPVEAAITRFLTFFDEASEVEKIGPVRSARPYFVDWNNDIQALYAHVGGSPDALDLIKGNGTFDLNEFWNGNLFWRDQSRYAPHNTYTSTEKLKSALEEAREQEENPKLRYNLWQYDDVGTTLMTSDDKVEGVDLTINFKTPSYKVVWEYDPESNQYLRRQAGLPHVTDQGERLSADNIVVMVTDVKVIDTIGRREIRTIGEGQGWLFRNGKVENIFWDKASEYQRLRFYFGNQEDVFLNPGTTWIEVVKSMELVKFEGKGEPVPRQTSTDEDAEF